MLTKRIIDDYVQKEGKIKVAIAGAGYMAKGFVNQVSLIDCIQIVAIASKTREKAESLSRIVEDHDTAVFDDVLDLVKTDADVVMDLTGDVETGALIAEATIASGKHIMTSAETDSTVGPVLAEMADNKGVIYTNMWGDEPGLTKGLYDYAEVLGFEIIAIGKFKGFHNPYATPESVLPWAEKSGQNPTVISSFADGSKLSMEMAVLSNATGFVPDIRGMHMTSGKLEEVTEILKLKEEGGILGRKRVIEVIKGAEPSGAVFAVIRTDNPDIIDSFRYYKQGNGPNYILYTPFHMPGIEMAYGIMEMMIMSKPSIRPLGAPVCDVMTFAKKDLEPGDVLGEIGSFEFYGQVEVAETSKSEGALPLGLAAGGVMKNGIKKGEVIHWSDVEVMNHDTCIRLRKRFDELLEEKYE